MLCAGEVTEAQGKARREGKGGHWQQGFGGRNFGSAELLIMAIGETALLGRASAEDGPLKGHGSGGEAPGILVSGAIPWRRSHKNVAPGGSARPLPSLPLVCARWASLAAGWAGARGPWRGRVGGRAAAGHGETQASNAYTAAGDEHPWEREAAAWMAGCGNMRRRPETAAETRGGGGSTRLMAGLLRERETAAGRADRAV